MSIEDQAPAAVEAIAIVGMAGRFPRARTLAEFWQRLIGGEELVTFFSADELRASGVDPALLANPSYVPARAVLDDAELFDAAFFGINPREAELMDPQQRVFLECAWEALEDAGYDPGRYPGAIGLYGGLSMNSYLFNNLARNPGVIAAAGGYQLMLASDKDFLATRVAYKLDLHGPAVTIQTACSTSLVAVQMACQSLLAYQSDMALAGGVSVGAPRAAGYEYQPGMIMSPDGHCRAFDARGRGIVAGEGAGLVVLKRLSDALTDGDTVHAIIRGAAINNDGAAKVGYTAPSVDGQAEVVALAQAMAGVDPSTLGYVEAHGTATELGDPIEVAALTQAFAAAGVTETNFCALGSVKTNLGHLDAAAGIAGLLKTVLALEHGTIPPSLHFERPNPNIDFASSPFFVATAPQPWPQRHAPRRAGVSSFGIGGTNAHVVLEEAAPVAAQPTSRPDQLLVLSGRTAAAVQRQSEELAAHLRAHPETPVADVAYTLQLGRKEFTERRAIVVPTDHEAAARALENADQRRSASASTTQRDPPVAFLFPGQGTQHVDMARELYALEPHFRSEVDRCAEMLAPHLGFDLRTVLFPREADTAIDVASATARLQQTGVTQPALFVIEYALAQLWRSWGVAPTALLGHSIGEYVAACLAGVFTLEDALQLVAVRGRLMQAQAPGSMLAISLSEAELRAELGPEVSLAAVNAPRLCVASGPSEDIAALRARLEDRGIQCRPLHTSHAFHSAMMAPALEEFAEHVAAVPRSAPQLPFISNVTGTWITAAQAVEPAYWAAQLRSTVRFADGLETLWDEPSLVLLEVGPGQTLSGLARQHPARTLEQDVISSMRHPQDPAPDHATLLGALGRLWLDGVAIDWTAVHAPETRRRVPLPTYPFERQRFWVEPDTAAPTLERAGNGLPGNGLPGKRPNLDSWFYQPTWRRSDRPAAARAPLEISDWLVFTDQLGLGARVCDQLSAEGHRVVRVQPGESFSAVSPEQFRLRPGVQEDYVALMDTLRAAGQTPDRVLHLWNLAPISVSAPVATSVSTNSLHDLAVGEETAFYSLLYLAQALGEHAATAPETRRIDVVGNGIFDVLGDETLDPVRATLLGPCRVIPQEYAMLCGYVDVRLSTAHEAAALAPRILAELATPEPEPAVALRGAHRWLPSVEPVDLPDGEQAPYVLRERGVYLITGGLGGVGLALADYLARTVRARLVLTGRGGLPERSFWSAWIAEHGTDDATSRRIAAVRTLEAAGAEVLVLAADITNHDQIDELLSVVHARFGPLNGIIHAAGIPGGGLISLKTREAAAAVLAPKVTGTLVLADATAREPLDFLALCSSFSSLLGGLGQVDYCAANAFLDAFADAETRRGRRTIAVNWGVWQEVGMAVETDVAAQLQHIKQLNLSTGMLTSEGQAAFARILNQPLPRVFVSPQDLPTLFALATRPSSDSRADTGSVSTIDAATTGGHARPAVATEFAPPSTPLEQELATIWQTLLGIDAIGVHDSFFDLGGHSLLATRLLARVQQDYGLELPLRTIFEFQTIAALAGQIEGVRWATAGARGDGAELAGEREEFEL